MIFILLFFIGFSTSQLFTQIIPNADFENWESSLIFTYDPINWITDNQEVAPARVVPDSLAYSNDLAMRVIAQPDVLGMHGEAYTIIPVFNQYIEQLTFYAKWEKTPTANLGVRVEFYTGNQSQVYVVEWTPTVDTSEWTLISMNLLTVLPEVPPINEIKIRVIADVGDFAPGEGWIAVDAMEFSSPTEVENITTPEVLGIYPNPCLSTINLTHDLKIKDQKYKIIDLQGRTIQEGSLSSQIDVELLPVGQYVLQIIDQDKVIQEKFTKR